MKREKVGKVAYDLMLKSPEEYSAIELEQAMQEDYLNNLIEKCDEGKKIYPGSFYLVVITKNEKLMPNVFRNYFFCRATCPTPDYDQALYRYDKTQDSIRFIWVIPSRDSCYHLKENALIVDDKEKELLAFVLKFSDGTLYKLAKEMNSEEINSPLIKG